MYIYIYIPGKVSKQEHLKVAILSSRLTSQKCPSQVPGLQLRPQSSTVPAPCFNDKSFSKRLILAQGSDSEAVGMSMSIEIIEWLATSGPPIRMPPRVTLTLKHPTWIRHGNIMATTRSNRQQSRRASISYSHDLKTSQNWRFWDHHPTWHGNAHDTAASIGNAEHQSMGKSILHAASSRDSTGHRSAKMWISPVWKPGTFHKHPWIVWRSII